MPTDFLLIRRVSLLCLVLLVAGIFIGGAEPGAGSLFPAPWDKVVHVLAYGTMAVLAGMAFPGRALPFVVLIVASIGAADEIHQIFLPGRQAGVDDWLADLAGSLLFIPILMVLRKTLYDSAPSELRK